MMMMMIEIVMVMKLTILSLLKCQNETVVTVGCQ